MTGSSKLLLVDFGREKYGYRTSLSMSRSGGGPTVHQERYLNSTLGFAWSSVSRSDP